MSSKTKLADITIDWRTVGRRIRTLRGFDCSQGEFAESIGITQSHVSSLERGLKEIGVTVLLRIAIKYGKSMEWLLTGSDRGDD